MGHNWDISIEIMISMKYKYFGWMIRSLANDLSSEHKQKGLPMGFEEAMTVNLSNRT